VPRLFSTALLIVLLGASAVAFVATEGLKLEPSPITKVFVTKIFSPSCECDSDFSRVKFRLRKADTVTLSIVGAGDRLVRTLVGPVHRKKGALAATWDGLDESGAIVPDGVYRPQVHLSHRTILMPNRIRVDTTPPVVKLRHVGPRLLEPGKRLKVRYLLNEPGQVSVFLNGRRVVLGHATRLRWKVEWPVRGKPGKYRVTIAARDIAGNLSSATRGVTVVIPLRVVTTRVRVGTGRRFAVRLITDGRAYHWSLAKRGGFASARRLVLRAPQKPGRYTLVIRQDKVPHAIPIVVKP
jgi:FlgD Ig-like domain